MVVSARRVLLSSVCRPLHPNCAQLAWCTPQSRWATPIYAENAFCQRRINNILGYSILGPGVADLPCFPISRSWVESLPSSFLMHSSRISQMVLVLIGQAKMETVSMRCHWTIGLSWKPRFKTSRCIGNRLMLEDPGSTIPAEDVADSLDSVVDWVRAWLCCGLGQIEAANAARSWLVSSSAQDRFATTSVLFVSFCHIFFKLFVSSLLLAC